MPKEKKKEADEITFPEKNCFIDERRPCSERCRWRNDKTEDCRLLELFQVFVQSQFQGQQVDFTGSNTRTEVTTTTHT